MRVNELSEKIRVKFPHMAHLDDTDLMYSVAQKNPEVLKRVDRADLAKTMRDSQKRKISQQRQKEFGSLSGYSRFMAGTGQGMMDVYQGIKQIFGGDTKDYQADKSAYMEASEGDLAAGLGEVTGAIAATAPIPGLTGAKLATKVASPLAKTAVGVGTYLATGAGMGATEFVDEYESRLANTAYGTLFGAGGALAGKLTGKAFNALKGKYKNAKVQELMDLAKAYDVEPSLGDITDNITLKKAEILSENIPVAGMSGFREKGAKKVKESASKLLKSAQKELGDESDDWDKIIQKSGKNVAKNKRKEATALYNKVEDLSEGVSIAPENTKTKVSEAIQDAGILEDEAVTKVLSKIDKGLEGEVSFSDMRKLRSKIGAKAEDLSLTNRDASRQLRGIKDAVEKDLSSYAETANPELKKAWKQADSFYKTEVVPIKDKMLAKAMKSDEPDQIYSKFIQRGKGDRAGKFYNALDDKGRSAVRLGMLSDAYETAVDSKGIFSPTKFNSKLEKLKKAKDVFFKGDKKKEIEGFQRLMEHSERFGQFAENPPTGNRMAQILGAASYATVGIPASALGIRLLSSKAGKRLVLAASELDAGSSKLESLIKSFQKNLPKTSAVVGKTLSE